MFNGKIDGDTAATLASTQRQDSAGPAVLAFSANATEATPGEVAPTLRAMPHSSSHANSGHKIAVFDPNQVTYKANRSVPHPEVSHTLPATANSPVAFEVTTLAVRGRGDGRNLEARTDGTANALMTPNGGRDGIGVGAIYAPSAGVRRLTPRECERLQGFPDDYTLIPVRGKPAADGPRYKALGNSMAVPVMAWIGRRIQMVEDLA